MFKAVTLDMMAKRYGKLPSEVLSQATTIDLQVLDVALSYENMKMRHANGEVPQFDTEDLLKAVKEHKG